jgi:hypothetical protein
MGNVVQLISRSSGKPLQIVTAPQGHLVVDGMGLEGPSFLHGESLSLYSAPSLYGLLHGE